jgi:hypothetical protein
MPAISLACQQPGLTEVEKADAQAFLEEIP